MTTQLIDSLKQQITETKGKRVRPALTHRQYLSDVYDSLVIEKRDDHLVPIVINAIQRLIEFGNEVRLKRAASWCINPMEIALRDEYQANDYDDPNNWTCMSDHDFYLEGIECDEQGDLISKGSWESYAPEEESMKPQLDEQKLALQQAVKAVNKSAVFKTIGIELIVTEDLLIFGGMLHG